MFNKLHDLMKKHPHGTIRLMHGMFQSKGLMGRIKDIRDIREYRKNYASNTKPGGTFFKDFKALSGSARRKKMNRGGRGGISGDWS